MKIIYSNEKKYVEWLPLITNLFNKAAKKLYLPANVELNYIFCSPLEIKKINKMNRGVNRVTDVLSFPMLDSEGRTLEVALNKEDFKEDTNPDTGNIVLGDICVCFRRIKRQARKYKNSLERELMYMSCHGLLHLLGYDHDDEENKKTMREKEELILHQFKISQKDAER